MNTSMQNNAISAELRGGTVALVLLGLWVIVSPLVFRIPATSALMWNNLAVGVAAVLLAFVGGWKQGMVQALTIPLSAWLFASAFLLSFAGLGFLWNNVLSAFALIATTLVNGGLRSIPSTE